LPETQTLLVLLVILCKTALRVAEEKSTERKVRLFWRSAEAFSKLTSNRFIRQQPIPQLQTPPTRMSSTGSRTLTDQLPEGGIYVGALGDKLNRRCHEESLLKGQPVQLFVVHVIHRIF
jgi:hypothetical protein